jgi:hypothetical protein
MFCLEETTAENVVNRMEFKKFLSVACECTIYTHNNCWMQYILHKGNIECPICHKVFTNQYQAPHRQQEEVMQVNPISLVVVNGEYGYMQRSETSHITRERKCIFGTILFSIIIFMILIYYR